MFYLIALGRPINIFKLNEYYLCNHIEKNIVTHTTPLEGNIFFHLCLTKLFNLSKENLTT